MKIIINKYIIRVFKKYNQYKKETECTMIRLQSLYAVISPNYLQIHLKCKLQIWTGVRQMLTSLGGSLNADRGEGLQNGQKLTDVMCKRSIFKAGVNVFPIYW